MHEILTRMLFSIRADRQVSLSDAIFHPPPSNRK